MVPALSYCKHSRQSRLGSPCLLFCFLFPTFLLHLQFARKNENKNITIMILNSLKKEPYVAPQWNLRAITIERTILEVSPGRPGSDDTIIDDEPDY